MTDYLAEIEQEIIARKKTADETPAVPAILFDRPAKSGSKLAAASEIVEQAFNQAVVHTVATDESAQQSLLDSAEHVIRSKAAAISARADLEDKTAHFHNKKGACECFGYSEESTEKWAVNFMALWHNIMTIIWLFVGVFTFAPITFVAKKITVIFKRTWVAIALAIIIYIVAVGGPILAAFLSK